MQHAKLYVQCDDDEELTENDNSGEPSTGGVSDRRAAMPINTSIKS